jgi:hypothetical protein
MPCRTDPLYSIRLETLFKMNEHPARVNVPVLTQSGTRRRVRLWPLLAG